MVIFLMVNHGLILVAKKVIFMMVITGDFYGIMYVYIYIYIYLGKL